jgi:hypothetical protein
MNMQIAVTNHIYTNQTGHAPAHSSQASAYVDATANSAACYDDLMRASGSTSFPAAAFVKVTPELANLILSRNSNNRQVNKRRVKKLASYMQDGKWMVNGESVIIANTGELNDGQHRLLACVEAKTPFVTLVVYGVARDSRVSIDLGQKRTGANVLGMQGEKFGVQLAHACRVLDAVKRTSDPAWPTLEANELPAFLEQHPEIRYSVVVASRVQNNLMKGTNGSFSTGAFAALHYVLSELSKEDAERFFDRLATGLGFFSQRDPILVLRNRLTSGDMKFGTTTEVRRSLALAVRAWNNFRSKKLVRTLAYRDGEQFPTPV